MTTPYRLRSGLVDVTQGNNSFTLCSDAACTGQTTVVGFDAARGYDLASGLGTPDAAVLVAALVREGGSD